jgi:crotonobetainyl-CoA:carnitine CoA-transferase CaiB-like acyl-CoA transferase
MPALPAGRPDEDSLPMKLEGLRVLDRSLFLPGPHLTMMMAAGLGAPWMSAPEVPSTGRRMELPPRPVGSPDGERAVATVLG